MPFYVRLGPHGLIIAIGAVLHSRLGRAIYRRKNRQKLRSRPDSSTLTARQWMIDAPENLTPSSLFVQIIKQNKNLQSANEVQNQLQSVD
jgi:hypothetical protein